MWYNANIRIPIQEIITDISNLVIAPFIYSLRFKLRVLPRGILSPSYKTGVDSRLYIYPLELSLFGYA